MEGNIFKKNVHGINLSHKSKKKKQKQERNEGCEKHSYEYIVNSQVSSLGKLIKTDMPQANTTEMPDVSSKENHERRCTAKINVRQVRK